jgi:spermidine/putrescine transport system substrate-binding protein
MEKQKTEYGKLGSPLARGVISRRDFLKMVGTTSVILGTQSILSACSKQEATQQVVPLATEEKIGGTIDFLSWEGYDLLNETKTWREQNGVEIASTYIGSMEDTQAKLVGGAGVGYDLISYNQGYDDLYLKLNILTPLEIEKISNYPSLMPLWRAEGSPWVKDGKVYGVPFTWGPYTLTYNADEIEPKEFTDLLDPKWAGRIGIVDDMLIAVPTAAALAGLGDKLPNLTKDELDKAMDTMREYKAQARGIAPSYGELTSMFVAGEIVAAIPCWGAVAIWAQGQGANIKNIIPNEGAFCYVDAYAIPPTSDNRATTLAFIDEALTKEIQAAQALSLAACVVRDDAVPLLDASVKDLVPYDNLDLLWEKAPFTDLPPQESDTYATYADWIAAWEAFKAS